jgi:ankyrin repeat protein
VVLKVLFLFFFFLSLKVRASCLLEARNFEGDTPLHMAVHNGHLDVLSALIGYGANINVRDLGGNTPLHIAVKYPSIFMTMLLICAGR